MYWWIGSQVKVDEYYRRRVGGHFKLINQWVQVRDETGVSVN